MQESNKSKEANTELFILQCAEEVFLERGFDGAKTTEIARRAGVNHAMLHYYFRTKANLFDVVFQNKINTLASSFDDAFSEDLSFQDQVRVAVESHFDFVAQNPKLIFFIYTEIVNNDDRKKLLFNSIYSKIESIVDKLEVAMDEEIAKGIIRKVNPVDLILNIVSLNITTFIVYPIVEKYIMDDAKMQDLLSERKENNVNFILNSLKIEKVKPQYKQTSLDFGF